MNQRIILPLWLAGLLVGTYLSATVYSPASVEDVQQLVVNARENDQTITIVGAGRGNSVKNNSKKDFYELKQDRMNGVISVDVKSKKITVQPGITWAEILEAINPFGLSVAVMQSFCDFSVGGTIGVNAHGQDFRFAPIAQTIDSMVIVDAQGSIKKLSRSENNELFSLVIGGYGLFGVIVEVTLHLVDNVMLEKEVTIADNAAVFAASKDFVLNNDIALYSARFDMGSCHFMERMLTITYKDTHEIINKPLKTIGAIEILRGKAINTLFNLVRCNSFLRNARIHLESALFEGAFYTRRTRNNAMYYKTGALSHSDDKKIEILQEYFVPLKNAEQFIQDARRVLKKHGVDVLNCTLRYVKQDTISYLPYASETVAAFVFYCMIDNNQTGFKMAKEWTCELVDTALKNNARFYLPYYCFATKEQVRMAYPEFDSFITLKKKYDPQELFVNDLYLTYQ